VGVDYTRNKYITEFRLFFSKYYLQGNQHCTRIYMLAQILTGFCLRVDSREGFSAVGLGYNHK
jgi:hypothetical protein